MRPSTRPRTASARAIAVVCLSLLSAIASAGDSPPVARVQEVHDTYFGTDVVDPYRWMETTGSAELAAWMKAQNAYTRGVFERLARPRQRLLARIRKLQAGTAAVRFVTRAGDRYFFLETLASGKAARLMTRAVAGGKTRVLLDPATLSSAGSRASVDFYRPSPDGAHVAVAVSRGGAEDWVLRIVETRTGKLLPGVVSRIANPFPSSWASDGGGFYYSRLQELPPGAPETAKYDNVRVYFHAIGTDAGADSVVFGPDVDPAVALPISSGFPDVDATRDGRLLIASHVRGTDSSRAMWVRDLKAQAPHWRSVAGQEHGVTSFAAVGGRIYAISQKDAPNGRVLAFDPLRETIADADVVLPEGDIIIATDSGHLAAARDGLYVVGQRDGQSVVRRLSYTEPAVVREMKLPAAGSIIEFTADETVAGVSFALQSPTLSPRVFRYDPQRDAATDTRLRAADPADFSSIVTQRVEIPSTGGVQVPMTITARKGIALNGTNPVLLVTYGSYGAIVPMWFSAPDLAWYERGGVIAFVHARGGGEKGAAWHEAGRRANKQRTVDDVIAAAEWLIARGYTSPAHLAVAGKSAGGIPVGGAITQRPDLFRAALFRVGVTDMLRIEHSSGGAANTMEYGSSRNEAEFRALHALSPYGRVKDGVAYPAVLLETGINDPRVPPWQLAKMTARLQAATSSDRPILLRVDYDAGHGLGSDKSQIAELLADEYAFLGWQLGLPGFGP
jgi:prolyl oligopeptidase